MKPACSYLECLVVLERVFQPKRAYTGQYPTILVRTKMPASTSSTMATVPVRVPVKYSTAITTAMINLIILSAVLIFFFILFMFNI